MVRPERLISTVPLRSSLLSAARAPAGLTSMLAIRSTSAADGTVSDGLYRQNSPSSVTTMFCVES